jgi:uncharacterized membrane protein YuzA (DUF378 family)
MRTGTKAQMPGKETTMKASGRNPADILAVALGSVGALSLGLLSLGRFDLVSEPFGSMMVWSGAVSAAAAMGIIYEMTVRPRLKQGLVRVRA